MKKTVYVTIEIDTEIEQTESSYTQYDKRDPNRFKIMVYAEKKLGMPVHHTLSHELGHLVARITEQPAHVAYEKSFAFDPWMRNLFPQRDKEAQIRQEEEAWDNAERMLFNKGKAKAMRSYTDLEPVSIFGGMKG